MQIARSALFKKQIITYIENYRKIAGEETAKKFYLSVDEGVKFIGKNPQACKVYLGAKKYEPLKNFELRQWGIKFFPHSIFFRIKDNKIVLLEAIYAHRMNTSKRLVSDFKI